ncbi:GPI mannosyltransferase 2 [Biomphalaria pfeifferi]|uniref:GPI mannosyltransferase 2 n=1 Tax=Biomphalaria pfeifferi TaxID=112525 RepID=A0AAD8AT65_BIOPF|nr:GPI mannosyltransferase 2 [Biomphalaria pfeifferi]
MNIFEHRLCIFAFYSRLSILLLQFVSNFLVPDHDAKVFNPPPELEDNSWLDQLVLYFVGGLRRWDAVYFTHIMQYGYTYENCVAFFPLYPLLVSNFSKAFSFGLLNFSTCLLLVGVVVNILLFVATSLVLYRLDWPKHVIDYGRSKGYKLAGDEPSLWCNETIPLSYSYIQKHHWNVGFLTYYNLKQLPNFLLALPVLILSFRTCSFYITNNVMSFCFLGLTCSNNNGSSGSSHVDILDSSHEDEKQRNRLLLDKKIENYAGGQWDEVNSNKKLKCEKDSCRQTDLIVYVYHLAFLTIFGCFFMHVQVLTRMLFSSSPLLYWYVGTLFINGSRRFKPSSPADKKTREAESFKQGINLPQFLQSLLSLFKLTFISEAFKNWYCLNGEFRAIFVYFLTYSVLGTVMFSNFLPWT